MGTRIQNVQPKEYNGIKYRSTLEAATAKTLSDIGIPFDYECRKITLQDGFRSSFQKDKVRAITYTPDFIVGPIILECKGFETPEWKIKKKLVLKYLQENEPNSIFYQIKDAKKQLLQVLDNHWSYLGLVLRVTSKASKKYPARTKLYDSIQQAMEDLSLKNKNIGPILHSLTKQREYVYNYKWELIKFDI